MPRLVDDAHAAAAQFGTTWYPGGMAPAVGTAVNLRGRRRRRRRRARDGAVVALEGGVDVELVQLVGQVGLTQVHIRPDRRQITTAKLAVLEQPVRLAARPAEEGGGELAACSDAA